VLQVRYQQIVEQGELATNFQVRPGDRIHVQKE
jgi:hypothetical protein